MTPEPLHPGEDALRRGQGEFLEMPGLRVTRTQTCRLRRFDAASSDALPGTLVAENLLFQVSSL